MSSTDQSIKQEAQPLNTSRMNPPGYMAQPEAKVEDGGMSGNRSLYQRITNSQMFQMSCRVVQCLASIVGTILFAYRLYKIAHTAGRITTTSNEAVMAILGLAVLYDIGSIIAKGALRNGGSIGVRIVWVFFDIAFAVAFILVAELTAPGRGMTSGPCHTYTTPYGGVTLQDFGINCQLPIGTFITAIVNIIFHTLTAVFNPIYGAIKNKRARSKMNMNGSGM